MRQIPNLLVFAGVLVGSGITATSAFAMDTDAKLILKSAPEATGYYVLKPENWYKPPVIASTKDYSADAQASYQDNVVWDYNQRYVITYIPAPSTEALTAGAPTALGIIGYMAETMPEIVLDNLYIKDGSTETDNLWQPTTGNSSMNLMYYVGDNTLVTKTVSCNSTFFTPSQDLVPYGYGGLSAYCSYTFILGGPNGVTSFTGVVGTANN
jgi:hypothetical protein